MSVRITTTQATVEALIRNEVTVEWELADGQVFTGKPTSLFRDDEGYWVRFKQVVEDDGTERFDGEIHLSLIKRIEGRYEERQKAGK